MSLTSCRLCSLDNKLDFFFYFYSRTLRWEKWVYSNLINVLSSNLDLDMQQCNVRTLRESLRSQKFKRLVFAFTCAKYTRFTHKKTFFFSSFGQVIYWLEIFGCTKFEHWTLHILCNVPTNLDKFAETSTWLYC